MSVKIRKNGAWVPIGGDKGDKGEKGFKGDKGNVDDKGNKGVKGEKGDLKGDKGDKGQKGEKAAVDDKGNKGEKGSKGDKGLKGDVEEKGNKGDKGLKGLKGDNKGEKGDKGIKGDVEEKGNKGDKGIKGDNKGEKGQKGTKGEKGAVEDKGNKGDEGDKGDKGNVDDKGNKGEQGEKGNKGEFKGDKGQKGDVEAEGNKGQKGEKGQFKGEKGDAGQKGAIDEKGNKGEPGTGGVTINNDVNDYVLTATGNPSIIQAESRLRFDPTGRVEVYAGTGDTHIELGMGANNQYAYLDLIGDQNTQQPGGDFGARFLRGNTGANTFSQVAHRGTGDLQLYCSDGGGCSITSADLRLRNAFRGNAGPSNNPLSGGSLSGMRFLTNFYSGWAYNQSPYAIDSGISVNQADGLGAVIVIYTHTASATQHTATMYFVRLSYNQSAINVTQFRAMGVSGPAIGGQSFGAAGFGVSNQGTLTLTGSAGGNYFNLIGVGNIMV